MGLLIKSRNLLLTVLGGGSPRSVPVWLVLVRALCYIADGWLFISSHGKKKKKKDERCLQGSFIKALISFLRLHTHDLITFQRPHLLLPSHWGLEFQHQNLGWTHTFSPLHWSRRDLLSEFLLFLKLCWFFFFNFYLSIVGLKCCVNFRQSAKWMLYILLF